ARVTEDRRVFLLEGNRHGEFKGNVEHVCTQTKRVGIVWLILKRSIAGRIPDGKIETALLQYGPNEKVVGIRLDEGMAQRVMFLRKSGNDARQAQTKHDGP